MVAKVATIQVIVAKLHQKANNKLKFNLDYIATKLPAKFGMVNTL